MNRSRIPPELRTALTKAFAAWILGMALAVFIAILLWNVFIVILSLVFNHLIIVAVLVGGYVIWRKRRGLKVKPTDRSIITYVKDQETGELIQESCSPTYEVLPSRSWLDKLVDFCGGTRHDDA